MKNSKYPIFFAILLLTFFSACFGGGDDLQKYEGTIGGTEMEIINSEQTAVLVAYDIIYSTASKSGGSNTGSGTSYQTITYLPKDAWFETDGKKYALAVKPRYKKVLGKRMLVMPHHVAGYPRNLEKIEPVERFMKKNASESQQFLGIHSNLDKYIDYLINPEKDKNLRTYRVHFIEITTRYLKSGEKTTLKGEIVGDSLFIY